MHTQCYFGRGTAQLKGGKGREDGIRALIETCRELKLPQQDTFLNIQRKLDLSEAEVQKFMDQYWHMTK